MTKKQEQEILARLEAAEQRTEDQARTITQLNQKVRQTQQRYSDDIAWESLDPKKDYNYFGSFKIDGKEYGLCLSFNWRNSDRMIKSKEGKRGQRISVFPFKTSKEQFEADTGHSGPLMPDNDAENGRYDNVVVNKDHSLTDGDKPTHERGA